MKLSDIDKNFAVDGNIDRTGLKFYNMEESPFKIYGIKREGDSFVRLPSDVARNVNSGVFELCRNTAGGRVRFRSNTKKVAIIAKYNGTVQPGSGHMCMLGKSGLDLYADADYVNTFVLPYDMPSGAFESLINFEERIGEERDLTINLPQYSNLCELYIGIEENATLKAASPYKYETPVVYYGSSITQGGCASRPGNSYQAFLSRWIDCDYVNLGFSGSAKGEPEMAEYIAGLDMSVFVYDYDFNALTEQDLESTHYPFYKIIREKNPDLPIIMMSRPSKKRASRALNGIEIIRNTYNRAISEGDNKVWFLCGSDFFPFETSEFTVDNCHPTDLGFYFMAKGLAPTLEAALSGKTNEE